MTKSSNGKSIDVLIDITMISKSFQCDFRSLNEWASERTEESRLHRHESETIELYTCSNIRIKARIERRQRTRSVQQASKVEGEGHFEVTFTMAGAK